MTAALTGVIAVLKIVGWVLLAVLALVLVLLCIVLFVPVRYALDAEIPETVLDGGDAGERLKETARARAGFHWFFHALRGHIAYPEELSFTVKALWFTVMGGDDGKAAAGREPAAGAEKTPDNARKGDMEKTPDEAQASAAEKPADKVQEAVPEKPADKAPVSGTERHADKAQTAGPGKTADKTPAAKTSSGTTTGAKFRKKTEKREKKGGVSANLADFLTFIFMTAGDILTKPYEVFCKIQYTISRICDKISDVRFLLESETFDRAKETVLKQIVRLLKGIDPKRCDIRVLYGTGDPALTADVLAVYGMLYPVLGRYMTPEADFDRRVVGAGAHVKGRITLFRILLCAGIVFFNRDVRSVYRQAKKLLSEEKESA